MKHLALKLILLIGLALGYEVKGQKPILTSQELQQLTPPYINGFQRGQEPKGKLIQIGNLQYSMCEQNFTNGKQRIKVLLFDFNDAGIMYKQATNKWKNFLPILTDSVTLQPVTMNNCSGWQSYKKSSNTSEIYLGVCDRFFLTLIGESVELEIINKYLDEFRFDLFPK